MAAEMEKIIKRCTETIDAFGKKLIPKNVWHNCKGVVVINCTEIGFVFSLTDGDGIVIKKRDDGTWGAPSATMFTGAGAGAIFGKGNKQIIMMPMTEYGFNMFTAHNKWQLGAQVGLSVGPVGSEANINIDAGGHGVGISAAPVLYYVLEQGALLDVGIQENFISIVPELNQAFYGKKVDAKDIVGTPDAVDIPADKGVEELQAKLKALSG